MLDYIFSFLVECAECVRYIFAVPKQPINTFKPLQQSRQLALKAGLSEEKLSLMPCLRTFSNVSF